MIEIKVSENIAKCDVHGTSVDVAVNATIAAMLLFKTLSETLQSEDIARSLLIDAFTNEERLQKFREIREVNCEEVLEKGERDQ